MKEFLLVFIGGGIGSVARWLVSKIMAISTINLPIATLSSNILSCIVFGFVSAYLVTKSTASQELKLLMLTGFCGGFSTYSTFIVETVELSKSGQNVFAFGNILINFLFCVLGLSLGMWILKLIY